jgi:hypothetical protein
MFVRFLVLVCITISISAVAGSFAQANKSRAPESQPKSSLPDFRDENGQNVSLPEEMRIRMLIARRENEYKKVIQNVDKLNELASQVADNFHKRGNLSSDDMKKVGVIEKLAHQVLTHAGGEGVDDKELKPQSMGEAVDKMSEAAARIKRDVTAETRFVVSATVIASSNEVITLSRLIRRGLKN